MRYILYEFKADKYYELRLEYKNKTYFFALPKSKIPTEENVYLAILTKVTESDQILVFQNSTTKEKYNGGEIKIIEKGNYKVLEWIEYKIIFEVENKKVGQKLSGTYYLVKTKNNNYIFGKKKK